LVRICAIGFLRLLPFVTVLRIFPPLSEHSAKSDWIYDPEWWDLAEMQIVPAAVPRSSRELQILFIGNISWLKGFQFFIETAELAARSTKGVKFRLVGNLTSVSSDDRLRLANANVEIVDGNPSDAEFVGYIRDASFLWCCYAPEYDQSSGVFGRALQLGVPVIVRRGALLDSYARRLGRGFAIDFGDAAGLLRQVFLPVLPQPGGSPTEAMRQLSVDRLRTACDLPSGGH
jgi:glycosyltransferase involved in cell wall biosynthesis